MSTTNAQWRTTRLYKDILPKENPDDRAHVTILDKIFPYTMTVTDGLDATYALFQAVRYIIQNNIAGDMVECGVWRGG
jgi:O-methyltransferase